ncbi:hypothetical protein [Treponema sp.]|nr:hypothetical protein [Treponema sp.]
MICSAGFGANGVTRLTAGQATTGSVLSYSIAYGNGFAAFRILNA